MDNKDDKLIAAISEFKKVAGDVVVKIHGKDYSTVATRLAVARRTLGSSLDLRDTIIHHDDKRVIVQTEAYLSGVHVGTGMAEEIRTSSMINKTSALENCQSSSWGRCLANLGFANDNIASAEELSQALVAQNGQLTKALSELDAVSHLGSYQQWITKHSDLFKKVKDNNPIAYKSFQEKFSKIKTTLETKGVINGNRKQ
jgi:hypothetical protein